MLPVHEALGLAEPHALHVAGDAAVHRGAVPRQRRAWTCSLRAVRHRPRPEARRARHVTIARGGTSGPARRSVRQRAGDESVGPRQVAADPDYADLLPYVNLASDPPRVRPRDHCGHRRSGTSGCANERRQWEVAFQVSEHHESHGAVQFPVDIRGHAAGAAAHRGREAPLALVAAAAECSSLLLHCAVNVDEFAPESLFEQRRLRVRVALIQPEAFSVCDVHEFSSEGRRAIHVLDVIVQAMVLHQPCALAGVAGEHLAA